ncbi:GAF domain-containing protein [Ottowia testudinis]|uniref:GAF domain-containing protein n=1 Tax=Ottowia testudinis TaxID=2816950 RepID=A0A975CF36_9BURK|nr:GAF domain-containing protein [Ottowia testudinis]QTD43901.1 GAF domain-containing protein [Ottowia testudinis]
MWRWFRNKVVAPAPLQPGAEIAAGAGTGFDALAEPRVWALTVPMAAPPPRDETADRHSAELRRLAALQARGDAAYQYVVETAARICQTPIAAIGLLDGDTLWFKASVGFSAKTTAAAHSPCLLVIEQSPSVTEVRDLRRAARFAGCPLLQAHPGTCYYAGAPLITPQGVAVGAVSVADERPRELSPVQLRTLELLARQTVLLLEHRAPPESPAAPSP